MKYNRELLEFRPPHNHYYDGKRLLGVTTALSAISKGDAIVQWAANQAVEYIQNNPLDPEDPDLSALIITGAKRAWKQKKQEAADIGTGAHNWIEAYIKGKDPAWPTDPSIANSVTAALKWLDEHKWEPIAIEHQIYLPDEQVAGICDYYGLIDGVLAVPDWKTSKSLYPSYAYQTAAYLKALEDEFDVKIPHRWLVRIDKETGEVDPRFLPEEEIEKDFDAFKGAVTIYRREAELKKLWLATRSSSFN